jgi:hypothetical protein
MFFDIQKQNRNKTSHFYHNKNSAETKHSFFTSRDTSIMSNRKILEVTNDNSRGRMDLGSGTIFGILPVIKSCEDKRIKRRLNKLDTRHLRK